MSFSILVIIVTNILSIPYAELVNLSSLKNDLPLEHFSSVISQHSSSKRQSEVHPTSVPLSQFLPYGPEAGDTILPHGDDESSEPIHLMIAFPFMDYRERVLFVNINGLISFIQPISIFKPNCNKMPPSQRMVAPFWADVITNNGLGGEIFYRQSTDPELLRKVRYNLVCSLIKPKIALLFFKLVLSQKFR